MKKLALALSVVASVSSPAIAEGNAEAGKAKALVCSACHGVDGNSMIDMYPKLAGQSSAYIEKQLHDFRSAAMTGGKEGRANPIMGGMAVGLSDQDIENLAAFYSSQKKQTIVINDVPKLGESLYKGGDTTRGITACIACHGPQGNGAASAGFPAIGGQHANYIKAQLQSFHDGSRNNDLNGMMQDIAKKLTSEDMDALAKYIANLK